MIPDGHQLVIPRAAKSPYCSGGMTLVAISDAEVDTSAGSTSEMDSDVGMVVGTIASVSDDISVEVTASSGVAGDVTVLACTTGSGVCWEEGSVRFVASEVVGFDHQ